MKTRSGSNRGSKTASSSSSTRGRKRSSPENDNSNRNNMWKGGSKKKKSGGGSSSSSSGHYGGSSSLTGIDVPSAEKMFAEIADEDDPQTASMEGIFKLGEKIGIDATEDIRILVLLWKMGCNEKPAQMSKEEWMQGCHSLQIDSWTKLGNKLPALETGFLDQTEYKDFYKFCFQFNRQGTHRTLDKDLVVALLKLVLKDRVPSDRLDTFCTFVENNASYTRITLDQWTSFLDFCYEVGEDLSMYDESTSAWPVLIDEYVEYMEEQQRRSKG